MTRFLLAGALLLSACNERDRSDGSVTQECTPRVPATGAEQRIVHPTKPSSCMAVVLSENYCVYDAEGALSHTTSKVVGGCLSIGTD